MQYNFDPTQHGFLPHSKMPKCLKGYLHKKAFVKIICTNECGTFWYTSCYKGPLGIDTWTFTSGMYGGNSNHHTSNDVYRGCITSSQFASDLLIHLFGTCLNEETLKYGKERLDADSLRIPRRKRKIV